MARRDSYPTWNHVRIERTSRAPLHDQLYVQIRQAISSGMLPRGVRLPATRLLAEELRIARNTVMLAYARLASEGYLSHRVGAGTFVEDVLPEDLNVTRPPAAVTAAGTAGRLSVRGLEISHLPVSWELTHGYDLSPLVPALDHFPFETFRKLFNEYWQQLPAADLVYGEPGGYMRLRRQIAEYLGEARGIACDPEQIIVCASTLQVVSMAAVLLLDAGDKVIVEDPGHVGEIALLHSLGLSTVSVRCDREGIDLRDGPESATGARMAAITPVGQYPFGSNLSLERRRALIEWATKNGAWIIEDDANSEYRWSGKPLPPLAAMSHRGHVIYASSFNRTLGPGFRLAYLVAPSPLVDSFRSAQHMAGFHVSMPVQHVLAEFMQRGLFARHLRRHRNIYQERAAVLRDSLIKEFDSRMEVPDLEVGLQLTVVMNETCDDVAVSDAALRFNLDVPALSPHCLLRPSLSGFQIGFGNTPVSRIRRGVENLRKVVDQLRSRAA